MYASSPQEVASFVVFRDLVRVREGEEVARWVGVGTNVGLGHLYFPQSCAFGKGPRSLDHDLLIASC